MAIHSSLSTQGARSGDSVAQVRYPGSQRDFSGDCIKHMADAMLYLLMSEYVCATGGSEASSIWSSKLSETGTGFSFAALQTYSPYS